MNTAIALMGWIWLALFDFGVEIGDDECVVCFFTMRSIFLWPWARPFRYLF